MATHCWKYNIYPLLIIVAITDVWKDTSFSFLTLILKLEIKCTH